MMAVLLIGVLFMDSSTEALAISKETTSLLQNQVDASVSEADEPTNESSETTANVIEHMITDSEGRQINENSGTETDAEKGKEFYTIQTDTEKIFYLIIDKDGTQETVYFLTQVSDDDLIDVAAESSGTSGGYQENSDVSESAIPSNNTISQVDSSEEVTQPLEQEEGADTEQAENEENISSQEVNPMAAYIFYGVLAFLAVGVAYYLKVYRKKKENFVDDDEDEEELEEEWESEDEEPENSETEDDFFNSNQEEEE